MIKDTLIDGIYHDVDCMGMEILIKMKSRWDEGLKELSKQPLRILVSYTVSRFFKTGIQISLLNVGDVTSLLSFHKISGPSACS